MAEHPLTKLARVRARLDQILLEERARRARARAGSRRVHLKLVSTKSS
jgi:hypothetical protein